jgi:hypothetical protein
VSRSVSNTFKTAIYTQDTSELFLFLLEIDHADLDTPLRFVNNTEDVTSDSNVYTAFPFMINLPADKEDQLPRVTLAIDNIDQTIVQTLRELSSPATVSVSLILHRDPDTIEAGPFEFTMKNATYTAEVVTCELAYEDILNEAFPGDSFTPNHFTGLF